MPNVVIHKIEENKPALAGISEALDRVRTRAYEIFERRGGTPGLDLEDWFQAESELFLLPQVQLSETDSEVRLTALVSGYNANDLSVTAQPNVILIQGSASSEQGGKALYRRFEFGASLDTNAVTATLENGALTVTAQKANSDQSSTGKTASAAA